MLLPALSCRSGYQAGALIKGWSYVQPNIKKIRNISYVNTWRWLYYFKTSETEMKQNAAELLVLKVQGFCGLNGEKQILENDDAVTCDWV